MTGKKENENPSVGLLLCASKNDEVEEYAMSRTMPPMMVAQYQLQLPDKSALQRKLQELLYIPQIEEQDIYKVIFCPYIDSFGSPGVRRGI